MPSHDAVAAVSASLQRAEAQHRGALLDVAAYDVELDLTSATTRDLGAAPPTFGSVTTIRFTSGAGSTFLDLTAVTLHRVRLDGAEMPVDRLHRGRLPLDLTAGPHELVVEATMRFRNDGEGLHLAHDPADGEHYVYGMSFMDAASSWFACFDQPDLKAAYTLDVRVPRHWTVLGNAPAVEIEPGRWRLGPTLPIATYTVTLVAGPWHVVRAEHDGIALGLSARASLAGVLERDADDLLTVTRQSFDALHARFGIRYPFGDYHQAFVPEFNAGAMENPGCVTFREGFLSVSRLTPAALAGRASTVAHEMAHQWFGNLVTPAWWDDLWLNESFAEYLGTRVAAEATRYSEVWVDDVYDRRQWGLVADQAPTTHPVAGNGALDARAALQDFDGISYAKGAAVLKQLAAGVGDDVFFDGVVDHLARHRFGNATMADLVGSWERAGAGDLSGFVDGWLRTAGPDVLEIDRSAGRVRRVPPPDPAARSHAIEVAVHDGGAWRTEPLDLGPDGTAHDAGTAPALLDPCARTWAVTPVDPVTAAALPALLPVMTDPMLRATTWNSVRSTLHDGRLDPVTAFELVLAAPPVEDADDGPRHLMPWVLGRVLPLLADPDAASARLHAAVRERLADAPPGSPEQLGSVRLLVATAVDTDDLLAWRVGAQLPPGIDLDVDLVWRILTRLAELDAIAPDDLDRALDADPSTQARVGWVRARASRPTNDAKAWAWALFTGATTASNYEVAAAGQGLWRLGQHAVTTAYVDRYFADLPATVSVRAGWSLADAAEAFFPRTALDTDTLRRTEALAADTDLDRSLRRRLTEVGDVLRRQLDTLRRW